MIAGVCGGLGRHFGVDPVFSRIVFVMLTFAGGVGLLLYAVTYFLVPLDPREAPLGEDMEGPRGGMES